MKIKSFPDFYQFYSKYTEKCLQLSLTRTVIKHTKEDCVLNVLIGYVPPLNAWEGYIFSVANVSSRSHDLA